MPKQKTSPLYEKAKGLSCELSLIYTEISIIDKALAEMQVDKARAEMEGKRTNPLWTKFFNIRKKNVSFFAEPSGYREGCTISISEVELEMIRAFKQEQINRINREVSELSAQINGE